MLVISSIRLSVTTQSREGIAGVKLIVWIGLQFIKITAIIGVSHVVYKYAVAVTAILVHIVKLPVNGLRLVLNRLSQLPSSYLPVIRAFLCAISVGIVQLVNNGYLINAWDTLQYEYTK
jgi:hypothetical protein